MMTIVNLFGKIDCLNKDSGNSFFLGRFSGDKNTIAEYIGSVEHFVINIDRESYQNIQLYFLSDSEVTSSELEDGLRMNTSRFNQHSANIVNTEVIGIIGIVESVSKWLDDCRITTGELQKTVNQIE